MGHSRIDTMDRQFAFLLELDKLKQVSRRSYIADFSRHENSAEHSWHLAITLLTLKEELDVDLNIGHAVKMALIHDVCEIGAGDISVFDPDRSKKEVEERAYLAELSKAPVKFAAEIKSLWEEYEEQETIESRWVRVIDRLLPFMINLNTGGRTWLEQDICKSQVLEVNQVVSEEAPEIFEWMLVKIQESVDAKWLRDE